jgi:hypothetical protein
MRLLVLAREKVDVDTVRSALPGEDLEGAEVLVVTPIEESNPIKFWVSDVDDAIADAEKTAHETAEALDAREEVGDADPLLAIQDALATFPADRIVVIGDPDVAEQAREKFDVPVESA